MRVKEFCDKYGVDYGTVYSATATLPLGSSEGHYEYDELDMLVAVRASAFRRRDKARADLEKAERILKNCDTPQARKLLELL